MGTEPPERSALRARRVIGAEPILAPKAVRARRCLLVAVLAAAAAVGCSSGATGARTGEPETRERYRLARSGTHWDIVGEDRVADDLRARYPAFFEIILDPNDTTEPDLRPIRDDLERNVVDRRNFDALNAVAIAYFELNHRAESDRGGERYFADSFRAAKLLAVPWRAYGGIEDARLRAAILDFFEDAAIGEKLRARDTAGRVARVVASLERKESDPERLARIRRIVAAAQDSASYD